MDPARAAVQGWQQGGAAAVDVGAAAVGGLVAGGAQQGRGLAQGGQQAAEVVVFNAVAAVVCMDVVGGQDVAARLAMDRDAAAAGYTCICY